jgi:hypothetical protein
LPRVSLRRPNAEGVLRGKGDGHPSQTPKTFPCVVTIVV